MKIEYDTRRTRVKEAKDENRDLRCEEMNGYEKDE